MSEGIPGQPETSTSAAEPSPLARRPRRPFPHGVACGAGCGRTEGYRCRYQDTSGRRCVYWCDEHSIFRSGRTWCQRHANSVRWLRVRDGSTYEIAQQAAIHDRSPNLVGSLVDELDRTMTSGLMTIYGRQEGVQVVTDGHVRTAAASEWERGWGVFSQSGYVARVVLRAAPSEPPLVHVYANGMLVLARVPDWIANRGKGTDLDADRAKFRRDILAAVGPALPSVPEYDPDEGSTEA